MGSVKTAVGRYLAGGDLGQPFPFLLGGAAAEDQFGGDLRTGAQGTDANIAARELFGDHAHGFLTEPHAAVLFRNRQPEHAELGHLRDDLERDIAVGAVPRLRVADHFAIGELTHFLADRFQRLVEATDADRRVMALAHQRHQARAPLGGVAAGDQALDHRIDAGGDLRRRQAEVARPHHLTLAHGNAADNLSDIFAEPDANQMLLGFAQCAVTGHAFGIGGELAYRFDIGGEPGQPVGGALLAIEQAADHMAFHHHPLAHLGHGIGKERLKRRGCRAGKLDQFVFCGGAGNGNRHRVLGRGILECPGYLETLRVQCTKAK